MRGGGWKLEGQLDTQVSTQVSEEEKAGWTQSQGLDER